MIDVGAIWGESNLIRLRIIFGHLDRVHTSRAAFVQAKMFGKSWTATQDHDF